MTYIQAMSELLSFPEFSWVLVLAVVVALAFEFVNGFHDTANAVATVIYTRSLKSHWAVLYSGLLNFLGVMLAGVGVAYSIVHLFPTQAMLGDSALSISLIFAVLGAAIIWNLGTWYVGIPASSSHALIGSILGASMGYCTLQGIPLEAGVPWDKARQVMLALFVSPLLGFFCSALLFRMARRWLSDEKLFREPGPEGAPPLWIRSLLIATCGGVSFAHGSNDGQKGMGLIMLILMALAPSTYALNLAANRSENQRAAVVCQQAALALPDSQTALKESLLRSSTTWSAPLEQLQGQQRLAFRVATQEQVTALKALSKDPQVAPEQQAILKQCTEQLQSRLQYVATWVKVAVALALGLGTTVGWKRIVVTVGEKIGKTHLTYAQGAAAELMAATTILLADAFKMPVSTTHVLSSGVAGTMHAHGSGLQPRTVWQIAMAWILTLPVCISLAFGLFLWIAHLGVRC